MAEEEPMWNSWCRVQWPLQHVSHPSDDLPMWNPLVPELPTPEDELPMWMTPFPGMTPCPSISAPPQPIYEPIHLRFVEEIEEERTLEEEVDLMFQEWFGQPTNVEEDKMAIPSTHVHLDDFLGDHTRQESEMAIPSPKEDFIEDPIEAEIQAFLNAKDVGMPIPDEWQDPEEVLKELERLLYKDYQVCEPICVHEPEENSLDDLQTTHPPPSHQTGKFPNLHIFELPVCSNLISLGLKSVSFLHFKLGLKKWKTTKEKYVFKMLKFYFVVVFATPLAKARYKFGKGSVDVPFDNG